MKIFLIGLFSLLTACSCSHIPIKIAPEHKGVHKELQKYVDEFMWHAKQKNIQFTNQVTVGFKKIKSGNVIGTCTYGGKWREIDIDIEFWLNSYSSGTKMALMLHELAHCYCTRDHDYAKGKKYPKGLQARIDRALQWLREGGERPGYWEDGCPVSLMHPTLVDLDCYYSHFSEYTQEMLDRCEPW